MASTTVDPPAPAHDRLSLESIPVVDLRLLSQSELAALSLCSSRAFDLRRCDDVVIPKIDRSIFNESAGSRKQTYSRLRLAPRKPDLSATKPRLPQPVPLDSERAENSRIISLFKDLFYSSSSASTTGGALVSVNVEYGDALQVGPSNAAVPISMAGDGGGGERKRKRGRKPKWMTEQGLAVAAAAAVEKRRAKYECSQGRVWDEMEKGLVNKNGVNVNLEALSKAEDPYGPELRRRTQGREKPEELLAFITDLKGQWGSRRKKRKIVDANEFGDALPNGWKVLIAMKKRAGQAWVFCRRYISPSGRYFVSCKEVSSYLLSLTSPQDMKQQSTCQCTDNSIVENKQASGNVVGVGTGIGNPSLYVALHSSDFQNQQKQICISQTTDQAKQVILPGNAELGEVKAVSTLKCHKCSTLFSERDGLLNHLVSCHKRKRRKAGDPIEDEVLLNDGKYECQFCDRTFYERSSYFGHVGIHVKNYVKGIGGSPSVTPKQKMSDLVSFSGAPGTVSGTSVSVHFNATDSFAGTPYIQMSNEPNLIGSKLKVGSDAETRSDNCNDDQNNPCHHPTLNMGATQIDEASTAESSDKQDEIFQLSDSKVKEVEKPTIISGEPDLFAGDGKMLPSNENKDICRNSVERNASKSAGPGICGSTAVPGGDDKTHVPADRSQLDQENDGNFIAASTSESKGAASEADLPPTNKSSPSTNENVVDGSVINKDVEHSCHDEGAKSGINDDLMVESGSDHVDVVMDSASGVRHSGNLEECPSNPSMVKKPCGTTADKIGSMESTLAGSKVDTNSETCLPSGVQCTIGEQNYDKDVFDGLVNDTEVDLCSLGKGEVTVAAEHCDQQGHTESNLLPVCKNNDGNYVEDESEKAPTVIVMEHQVTGGSQAEQICSPEDATRELSTMTGDEPKCEAVTSSNKVFFSSSTDTPLNASVMADNEQEKIFEGCSHIPSESGKTHSDISDVLGAYNSFVDNKQEQGPKNGLSGLSMDEQMHEVTVDNASSVSAASNAMQLPELAKDESLQANKLMLDFGSMTDEMNGRFSNSVERETVSAGSSPFSLWGEQICVEDSQARAYGGGTGLQQDRASDNGSLNLVGLQQSCDAGYNLNKVRMNDQTYAVQHNETGYYNRSNQRDEGISHVDTLNSSGLQQQCDVGYNLNKPCLNSQSFGMQLTQAGAYSNSDEARQERVAYGNSLTLASVQQTCDTGYSLNKGCAQQTGDAGYSLNKGYIGAIEGLSKSDALDQSRDRQLMIGFGNNSSSHSQGIGNEFMWRTTEGNIQPGGLVDSSSSRGQSSGSFQAFDFLSDKGGNGLYTGNDKFDMSSFEGLRSAAVEPMEFSFMATQDSNTQLEDPKVLSYNGEMDQGFASSVWDRKGSSLPNMMGSHVVSTVCVWCGNEFHQDSLSEIQAGSIGFLCPGCKARMSGQCL